MGEVTVKSGSTTKMQLGKMEVDSEGSKFHLYETDALKAVSTEVWSKFPFYK